MMDAEQAVKRLKAGEIIIVRAKNGDSFPMFQHRPGAYRCHVGKKPIPGKTVHALMKRRLIVPVKQGWYTEGHFRFNTNLRDERGRFRRRQS